MNVLITGACGFIGKNLLCALRENPDTTVFEYDLETDPALLDGYCKAADFVFHLAGVNRPKDNAEFMEGNFGFTSKLLALLQKHKNTCPVMLSSSVQAALSNPYGESKKAGEDLLFTYGEKTGAKVFIYRFQNVFGKWCRPNYNSAVATFCHNIARDLPITVNDPKTALSLIYIDDLVSELMRALAGSPNKNGRFCEVSPVYTAMLGDITALLYSFRASRGDLSVPDMSDGFTKKLYAAYLSYLPENAFSYPLKMNADDRGSFTEFLRTPERGQVSINVTRAGVVKGNHWHHTKNEKFLVVLGRGVIRLRAVNSDKVTELFVSGEKLEVVDIPPGFTHNIENLGEGDMVTVMWANEPFDPAKPDTFFSEV